jgi:8-oxo-dGTP pyrophosphatase MutT (NUDIX family)
MPFEKSAGAIIFRKGRGKIYYLLLNYASIGKVEKTYWGFSKGHIEKGEKGIDAIIREIKEETGIKHLKFLTGFKEVEKYFFKYKGKTIFKKVYYLLAETKTKEIKLSFEHLGYKWLPYKKALEKLSFKNAKRILKKANEFLE